MIPCPAMLLACVAAVLVAGCGNQESSARSAPARKGTNTPAEAGQRAKGFRLAAEYFPATNASGIQRVKTMVFGSEARLLTKDLIFLTNPRIEGYKEDGTLEFIVTSVDALVNVNRTNHTAEGTNIVSFCSGDTNFFATGRGFHWQPTDSVLILSNQTYNWINQRMLTNSSHIE